MEDFKKREEEEEGGWETEPACDWLQLHAPSHLTPSLRASQSGASAPFERCQRRKIKKREEEEEKEESEMMNVQPVWICTGCTL